MAADDDPDRRSFLQGLGGVAGGTALQEHVAQTAQAGDVDETQIANVSETPTDSLAVAGETPIVGTKAGVLSLDGETGSKNWQFKTGNEVQWLAVGDGIVYKRLRDTSGDYGRRANVR